MQREFKHKITKDIVKEFPTTNSYFHSNTIGTIYYIPKKIVELGNDWEEINNKLEYQILKFKVKNDFFKIIGLTKGDIIDYRYVDCVHQWKLPRGNWDGYCINDIENNNLECILNKAFDIYSIRRISDNEIFTIGDDINHLQEINKLSKKIIDIILRNDIILFTFNDNCIKSIMLKNAIKVTTTEDKLTFYPAFIDTSENFILPKKWAILRTKENYKVINEWFNRKFNDTYVGYLTFIHSEPVGIGKYYNCVYKDGTKDKDFTEITFDQFKKYVLGKDNDIITETKSLFSNEQLNEINEIINKKLKELE